MPRTRTQNRYIDSIQCQVDLDSLIMSDKCSPEFIEENLNINDDILYDAIKLSRCSYWLLKLDVFRSFSSEFRIRLLENLEAFTRVNRIYFINQVTSIDDELKNEIETYAEPNSIDFNTSLFNPLNNLSNSWRDRDVRVLRGESTLRFELLSSIKEFLKSGDRKVVDFSYSLFLPEILNPKFFHELSEAEQLVVLGNMDKYFDVFTKFNRCGLRASVSIKEMNPTRYLIKHILSGELDYTHRVKKTTWKKLYKEILENRNRKMNKKSENMFDVFSVESKMVGINNNVLMQNGYDDNTMACMLTEAEGVFEAFEIDCTLKNLDSKDFLCYMLFGSESKWVQYSNWFQMSDGLIEFQDDDVQDELFKEIAGYMKIEG